MDKPVYTLEFEKPLRELSTQLDQLRQQSRDDEGHFREVFEQYLALRQQCGESITELSFDKFTVTLRKNRDTIMLQRPETKDVRFTVYVKAGKAALKATPVKN